MSWETLLDRAYTPYSETPRACVVQSSSGVNYPGVRIENASYPVSISAIQSALYGCLSVGDTPATLLTPLDQDLEFKDYWSKTQSLEIRETSSIDGLTYYDPLIKENIDIQAYLVELLNSSVTPNSDFPVSALLKVDGGYVAGVNIEVNEWSMGLCAERVAIARAISSGYKTFESLYLHTRDGEFSSPCGACRQVIGEQLPFHPVTFFHSDGSMSEHMTPDLLPHRFKLGNSKS